MKYPEWIVPLQHFFSTKDAQPIVLRPEEIPEDPNEIKETDSETVKLIKELLDTRSRPRVKADGGDIFFQTFNEETGLVQVKVCHSLFTPLSDSTDDRCV